MKLFINGEKKEFNEDVTLIQIIKELKIENKIMAIAINMEVVIKDQWNTVILKKNDKIDFLEFVGGG